MLLFCRRLSSLLIDPDALKRHVQRPPAVFGAFTKFLQEERAKLHAHAGSTLAHGLTPHDLPTALRDDDGKQLQELLSLKYATQHDVFKALRRKVVEFYGARANDTGRTEVQIGLYTARVQQLHEHCDKFRKDIRAKRLKIRLECRRRRMLRYLFKSDLDRYYRCLDELGLPRDYLEQFDDPYQYLKKNTQTPAKKQKKIDAKLAKWAASASPHPRPHRTVRGGGTHVDLKAAIQ